MAPYNIIYFRWPEWPGWPVASVSAALRVATSFGVVATVATSHGAPVSRINIGFCVRPVPGRPFAALLRAAPEFRLFWHQRKSEKALHLQEQENPT